MYKFLCLLATAIFTAATAVAQSAPSEGVTENDATDNTQTLEEIVVRGRVRLFVLRMELRVAREHVWDVFNDVNSDDDFDISCSRSVRTGSRIPHRACRPQYAEEATRRAGARFARLFGDCPPANAACIEGAMAQATSEAQEQIGRIAYMDQRLDAEFQQLARSNPELAIAIVEYAAKEREFRDAQQRRKD